MYIHMHVRGHRRRPFEETFSPLLLLLGSSPSLMHLYLSITPRTRLSPCEIIHIWMQEPRLFGEHLEVHPIIIILSLGTHPNTPACIRMYMYTQYTNQSFIHHTTTHLILHQPPNTNTHQLHINPTHPPDHANHYQKPPKRRNPNPHTPTTINKQTNSLLVRAVGRLGHDPLCPPHRHHAHRLPEPRAPLRAVCVVFLFLSHIFV